MTGRVTIAAIQSAVAAEFNVPVSEMQSQRKSRQFARPRQVAMSLACQLTGQSLPAIGRRFGDRDHTTVIYARDRIDTLRAVDPALDRHIRAVVGALTAPPEAVHEIQLEFFIGPLFDQAGLLGACA